jgi:hypothetical protein
MWLPKVGLLTALHTMNCDAPLLAAPSRGSEALLLVDTLRLLNICNGDAPKWPSKVRISRAKVLSARKNYAMDSCQ